jgi:hypothetical protein
MIKYARIIVSEVIDIHDDIFRVQEEFRWLCQLVRGQTLALELSKKPRTNPENIRRPATFQYGERKPTP